MNETLGLLRYLPFYLLGIRQWPGDTTVVGRLMSFHPVVRGELTLLVYAVSEPLSCH